MRERELVQREHHRNARQRRVLDVVATELEVDVENRADARLRLVDIVVLHAQGRTERTEDAFGAAADGVARGHAAVDEKEVRRRSSARP